jgi:nucleotide-binding universal stress UspA family protein
MYDCILVSLDGSRSSEAVLPEVEKLVKAHPAKVILLRIGPTVDIDVAAQQMEPGIQHAYELVPDEYDLVVNAEEREIRRYLDAIGERLAQAGATPIIEVSFTKPVDEILHYAKQYGADLIAMATHGRSGLARFLFGSVTENVLRQAPCPMLVVRSPEEPLPRFAPIKGQAQSLSKH